MIFPLISLFGVSMNSAFFIVPEAHVISNIFWPILFYVTLKESYSLKDVLVLLGLTIIFVRSYESVFFLGTILGFVSFSKAFKSKGKQKILYSILTTLFIVTVGIAGYAILYPRDPITKMHFIHSIFLLDAHFPVIMSISALLVLSLRMFLPDLSKKYFRMMAIFFSCVVLFVSFSPLLNPNYIRPSLHYNARVLMAYLIPLLAILYLFIVWKRIIIHRATWKQLWFIVTILIFGQVSWHILATSQWAGFRTVFNKNSPDIKV